MIDSFALALTHGLLLLAAWRLMSRDDLDREEGATPPADKQRRRKTGRGAASDA